MSLLALIATLWLLTGVAGALRDRLATRIARWALPDEQPWTYRLATVVTHVAIAIAPIRRRHPIACSVFVQPRAFIDSDRAHCLSSYVGASGSGSGLWTAWINRRLHERVQPLLQKRRVNYAAVISMRGSLVDSEWSRPAELLAELEANLRDAHPVANPLTMSFSVLAEAGRRRGRGCVVAVIGAGQALLALIRSTVPFALLEARLYELRYPAADTQNPAIALAVNDFLRSEGSIEEVAEDRDVSSDAVRRWVKTAYRDADRLDIHLPDTRAPAAKIARRHWARNPDGAFARRREAIPFGRTRRRTVRSLQVLLDDMLGSAEN